MTYYDQGWNIINNAVRETVAAGNNALPERKGMIQENACSETVRKIDRAVTIKMNELKTCTDPKKALQILYRIREGLQVWKQFILQNNSQEEGTV